MSANKNRIDEVVENLVCKFRRRSLLGISKYGTTLHENNLSLKQWAVHIQEELMDASLYLNKVIMVLDKMDNDEKKSLEN